MKYLLGKNIDELNSVVKDMGMPSFTAKQIADWLYKKRVTSISDMTNLSKDAREKLANRYEVGRFTYAEKIESVDGTKKYLFAVASEGLKAFEAVVIPDGDRATLCVSSQLGCRMECLFCMTGRLGFHGHLSVAEIISQVMEVDESLSLTNIVFMGMGEPLDNYDNLMGAIEVLTSDWGFGWSPKRITVSSIGVIPALKRYLEETKCHLAISLNNPFDKERESLMKVQRAFPIEAIVSLIKEYDFTGQRRVSFEYIMFDGVNDSKRHADGLIRLLRGLECRVNLIRFHRIPDSDLSPAPIAKIEIFKKRLNDAGVMSTIRASRGEDILAACGMLAGNNP